MAEKQHPSQPSESADPNAPPFRRAPGHRVDVRDTVAELAERAQVISQEAGIKVSAAMKDVISAAAGIAGFAIESARDLVQYMVRRGQMTPEEGERLIREAEAAHDKRSPGEKGKATANKLAAERAAAAKAEAAARAAAAHAAPYARPITGKTPAASHPSVAKAAAPSSSTVHKPAAPPPAKPRGPKVAAPVAKAKPAKPPKAEKPPKAAPAAPPPKPGKKKK
jgi:polyhydroxyalkanoate synthesis regulator phasin